MLMYQFKAPHRDWRPDSIYHNLFSNFDFPEPETFNDNYFGRLAASENMMEIENHLNRRDMEINSSFRIIKERLYALVSIW